MKKSKSIILISAALVVLTIAACSPKLYEPTSVNVSSDATMEQLKEGKSLYIANCKYFCIVEKFVIHE